MRTLVYMYLCSSLENICVTNCGVKVPKAIRTSFEIHSKTLPAAEVECEYIYHESILLSLHQYICIYAHITFVKRENS